MKLKDLPALILSLASLLTAAAGLVKAFKVEDSAAPYQDVAEQMGTDAAEVEALRARVAALEKETKR